MCWHTPAKRDCRKNRHLLEVARALMFTIYVPKHFCGEAILTVAYLINRMPLQILQYKTPLSVLLTVYPNIHLLSNLSPKTFGCTSYVYVLGPNTKFDLRAQKCIFLGYSSTKKGYKCYNPDPRCIYVTLDVTFMRSSHFIPTLHLRERQRVILRIGTHVFLYPHQTYIILIPMLHLIALIISYKKIQGINLNKVIKTLVYSRRQKKY